MRTLIFVQKEQYEQAKAALTKAGVFWENDSKFFVHLPTVAITGMAILILTAIIFAII